MTEFTVTGRIDSGLTHFALIGLAAILELDQPDEPVTFWWSEEIQPRAVLRCLQSAEEIAGAIHRHASRHSDPRSWVQQQISDGPRTGMGLFTARVKAPASDEWESYAEARTAAREEFAFDLLDEQMQSGLGEPAWWRCDPKETRPDDGASRWEMKTRNQGQEFLVHRLAPLASILAGRTSDEILSGLLGETVNDELGKNSSESRTSTGLSSPGPVDSAVAWCALWGLHAVPTVMRSRGVAASPGMWPRTGVHPRDAALPVFTLPVTARRFSEVVTSRSFEIAGAPSTQDDLKPTKARPWLREQGVRALVRFTVDKTGSASAPERLLLAGTLDRLE